MTDRRSGRYQLERVQAGFKAVVHEYGLIERTWAGCQFFQFGPEGEKTFLLTSPFIERIARIIIET